MKIVPRPGRYKGFCCTDKKSKFILKEYPKDKRNKCERETKRRSSKSDSEHNLNSKHDFTLYSMQHKQELQPEEVTLLLPAPGPGTLTAGK